METSPHPLAPPLLLDLPEDSRRVAGSTANPTLPKFGEHVVNTDGDTGETFDLAAGSSLATSPARSRNMDNAAGTKQAVGTASIEDSSAGATLAFSPGRSCDGCVGDGWVSTDRGMDDRSAVEKKCAGRGNGVAVDRVDKGTEDAPANDKDAAVAVVSLWLAGGGAAGCACSEFDDAGRGRFEPDEVLLVRVTASASVLPFVVVLRLFLPYRLPPAILYSSSELVSLSLNSLASNTCSARPTG